MSDETEKMERALETAGREYGKHSGPQSDERERRTFAGDLHRAALRYARAYYAEARELGLIPEYEIKVDRKFDGVIGERCNGCGVGYGLHTMPTDATTLDCPPTLNATARR